MAIIPCSINETNFVQSFIWNLPATLHHPATFNHDMTYDGTNTTRQPLATMAWHTPLSSASFTPCCCLLALSHRSLCTNPAANNIWIAYFSLAAPQEHTASIAVIPIHILLSTSPCRSVPLSPCCCVRLTLNQPLTDSKLGQWAPLIIILLQFVHSLLSCHPSPLQIVSRLVGILGIAGRQASQLHANGHDGASFHTAS